jgi:hypothetical protein
MNRKTPFEIPEKAKDEFWAVVEDCLVELHGLSRQVARQKSTDLRTRVELPQPGIINDIFYHAEPLYVAYDLAEEDLDDDPKAQKQYDTLLERYNW